MLAIAVELNFFLKSIPFKIKTEAEPKAFITYVISGQAVTKSKKQLYRVNVSLGYIVLIIFLFYF